MHCRAIPLASTDTPLPPIDTFHFTILGRDVFDLSLEDEYLSPAMFDSVPLCAGFDDFVSNDFRPQTHQSAHRTTVNGLGLDELDNANYGAMINPDDFLNDVSCDSLSNRDTPSPSDSQKSYDSVPSSGGFDRCHVVPMHLDSPPISPPSSAISTDGASTVNPITVPRRLKIIPKSVSSSSCGTKTITKKTIVLSAKDYRALLANMQRQPSSNTIILKATPTNKLPIGVSAVRQPLPTAPHVVKQEAAPFVLPKPAEIVREVESSPETTSPAVTREEPTVKRLSPLTVPMMLAAGSSLSEHTIDEKLLKKHQRMIKNRQSAYESRQKKKEYVTSLEERLDQLVKENHQLRVENANLLERVKMRCTCAANALLVGHSTVKQVTPTARKNAAIVLGMLFMVSLNFYPIGNLLTNPDRVQLNKMSDKLEYHSRGLLYINETSNSNVRSRMKPLRVNLTAIDELVKEDSLETTLPTTECPFYVNQTENIRLASELRKWIGENGYKNLTDGKGQAGQVTIDTFDKMFRLKDTIDSIYQHMKDISLQMKSYERRQKLALNGKKLARNRQRKTGAGQREIVSYRGRVPNQDDLDLYYPKVHVKYAEFFEEIGRRDDTFYLVSFSEEHLLLPALAYNKTNRPRMSLMLPTVTAPASPAGNGTNRSDKITLMQIDCEVMNTSVIQIREKTIPGDLRPAQGGETPKGGAGSYGTRNATNSESNRHRASGRSASGSSAGSRLVRSNSSTAAQGADVVEEEIHQKPDAVHHQHVPIRPFFVERMNEHLKSEHHVN
ncbi:cyclic AMP-dependent transcription factor ATF-6 alpha [Anopheles maculipalpis]|uniref:cyclic AMP-dependent transcription factor ATF-6 alpha n=1 Tax=Anopheles maculipalpis TaxID=1496333 RepID=UPI002158CCB1|nr:cyclic AMP-dependent transcription factor ATF-6 alpha [Anopheles maculipalpis]